jgi:hypothetical protein
VGFRPGFQHRIEHFVGIFDAHGSGSIYARPCRRGNPPLTAHAGAALVLSSSPGDAPQALLSCGRSDSTATSPARIKERLDQQGSRLCNPCSGEVLRCAGRASSNASDHATTFGHRASPQYQRGRWSRSLTAVKHEACGVRRACWRATVSQRSETRREGPRSRGARLWASNFVRDRPRRCVRGG